MSERRAFDLGTGKPWPVTPSKPLTPTELDELRRSIPGHPRESLDAGTWYSPETVARLLATLDVTQAVEPGLREAAQRWHDAHRFGRLAGSSCACDRRDGSVCELAAALAARSSSAPAELEALRELSDAATPGPWAGCAHVAGTDTDCPCRYRGDVVSQTTDEVLFQMRVGPDEHPGAPDDDSWKGVKTTDLEQGYVNGRFIAAAVNYVRSRLTSSPENPA